MAGIDPLVDQILPVIFKLENKDRNAPDHVTDTRVSPAGAVGRYQIMPKTARALGFDPSKLKDGTYNERVARAAVQDLIRQHGHDKEAIVAGYNTSPYFVRKFKSNHYNTEFLLPETADYVKRFRAMDPHKQMQANAYVPDPNKPEGWNKLQEARHAGLPEDDIIAWKGQKTKEALDAGIPVSDVQAYWGEAPADTSDIAAVGHLLASRDPKKATGFWENMKAGWAGTGAGMLAHGGLPETVPNENGSFLEQSGAVFGQLFGDVPVGIAAGVPASAAGPLATAAAAGTAPVALREIMRRHYMAQDAGHPQTYQEWGQDFAGGTWETAKALPGALVFGPAGKVAGAGVKAALKATAGKAALDSTLGAAAVSTTDVLAGNAAATFVNGAIEGHMPDATNFTAASVAMLATHAVHALPRDLRAAKQARQVRQLDENLGKIYARTGIPPWEVQERANQNMASFLAVVQTDVGGEPTGQYAKADQRQTFGKKPAPDTSGDNFVDAGHPATAEGSVLEKTPDIVSGLEDTYNPESGRIGRFGIEPDLARAYGLDPTKIVADKDNARAAGIVLSGLAKEYKGDLEAAYVAFHAGKGIADAWLASGRDPSVLPARTSRVLDRANANGAFDAQFLTREQEAKLEKAAKFAGKVFVADAGKGAGPVEDKTSIASYLQKMGKAAGFNFWVGDAETISAAHDNTKPYRHPHYMPTTRSVFIPDTPEELNRRWYGLDRYQIIYHEVAHAIDFTVLGREKMLSATISGADKQALRAELLEVSKRFRPKLWEMNPSHMAKDDELIADAIASWLSNPTERAKMPQFKKLFGKRMEPYLKMANDNLPVRDEAGMWSNGPKAEGPAAGGAGNGNGATPPPAGGPEITPPPPGKPKITDERLKLNDDMLEQVQLGMIHTPDPAKFLDRGKDMLQTAHDRYISELGPFQRMDAFLRKEGVLKENMAGIEDGFRNTYASASRAAWAIRNGGIDALTLGKTDAPSMMAAFEHAKKKGGTQEGLVSYMLSQRQIEKAAQGIETGAELSLEDAQRHVKMKRETYEESAQMLRKFNDMKLDYLRDSGLYSEKQIAQWKEDNKYWIPHFRVSDEDVKAAGLRKGAKFRAKPTIKGMTGDDKKILEPLKAMIESLHVGFANADRNRAIGQIVGVAELRKVYGLKQIEDQHEIHVQDENGKWLKMDHSGNVLGSLDANDVARRRWSGTLGPKEFEFYRNGKREIWTADDADIAKTIRGAGKGEVGLFQGTFRFMADIERKGITRMPDYLAKMLLRDQFVAPIVTKNGGAPFQNLLVGAFHAIKGDEMWQSFVRSGGLGSSLASYDTNYIQKDINKIFQEAGTWGRIKNVVADPIEAARLVAERLDAVSRVGQFSRDVRSGRMENIPAAMKARKAYLDFAEKGTSETLNMWASITPFMRPAILALDQDSTALTKNFVPVATKAIAYITVPTALMWGLNWMQDQGKDPDDPTRYDAIPAWERDTNWVLPEIGGVRIRIPRAQGLWGVTFGGLTERALEKFAKDDPRAFESWFRDFSSQMLPPVLPGPVTPVMEHYFGQSIFTGQKIIPAAMDDASGSMQYTENTTELAKGLSRFISDASGIEFSPMYMENYVRGWAGTTGTAVLKALDATLVPEAQLKPMSLADVPIIASFIVRNPTMQATPIQNFYTAYADVKRRKADFSLAVKRGDEYEIDKASRFEQAFLRLDNMQQALHDMYSSIDAINKAPVGTGEGEMTLEEKAQFIEDVYAGMIGISRAGLEAYDSLQVEDGQP